MDNYLTTLALFVMLYEVAMASVDNYVDMKIFPNIGYIGRGYNPYIGNPRAASVDPGFEAQIFQVGHYEQKKITPDRSYRVPDGVDAYTQLSCSSDFTSSTILGTHSYTNELMTSVNADFSALGAAFSANSGFGFIDKKTNSENSIFLESDASCEIYYARIMIFDPPPMTENFKNAVQKLPLTYTNETKAAYAYFFKVFGTHVATEVAMGARVTVRHEFASVEYSRLQGMNFNLEAVASKASSSQFKVGMGASFSYNSSDTDYFKMHRSSMNVISTGSRPPPDQDVDSWLNSSSFDDPAPIRYELQPISQFVGRRNSSLKIQVERAMRDFCKMQPGARCNKVQKDKVPRAECPSPLITSTWMPTSRCFHDSFNTHARQSCGVGHALTSLRLSRKRGRLPDASNQLVNIGCTRLTSDQEVPSSDRWTVPMRKSNGAFPKCNHDEFVTGVNFLHNCFQAAANKEFLSLQCRRSRVVLDKCMRTETVVGVKSRPRWTELSCPLGYLLNGIEFTQSNNIRSTLDTQTASLWCCESTSPCLKQVNNK